MRRGFTWTLIALTLFVFIFGHVAEAFRASSLRGSGCTNAILPSGKSSTPEYSLTRREAYPLTYGEESGEGRVALVTGASRGLGKAIATALATGGVKHVICVARSQEACDQVAKEIIDQGYSASGYGVDVSDCQSVQGLCEKLLAKHDRIDILVNNAGITKDNVFIRMSPQDWEQVVNVNLNSAFYFTLPIIKRMIKNRFGRIINMASVVGVSGNVGQANYSASKAGLIGFTKSIAKEYANRGITSNAIAPGFIESPMTDKMTDEAKKFVLAQIPAGRQGKPQEIAHLAAFLASDQAAYINGDVIEIDGALVI